MKTTPTIRQAISLGLNLWLRSNSLYGRTKRLPESTTPASKPAVFQSDVFLSQSRDGVMTNTSSHLMRGVLNRLADGSKRTELKSQHMLKPTSLQRLRDPRRRVRLFRLRHGLLQTLCPRSQSHVLRITQMRVMAILTFETTALQTSSRFEMTSSRLSLHTQCRHISNRSLMMKRMKHALLRQRAISYGELSRLSRTQRMTSGATQLTEDHRDDFIRNWETKVGPWIFLILDTGLHRTPVGALLPISLSTHRG